VVAGIICYTACNLKSKLGYDDSLMWWACTGSVARGPSPRTLRTKLVNEAGGDGLLYGNPKQLWIQFVAVVVTWILGFVMTMVILKVLDAVMGLRVSSEDEMAGLDLSQHSETAYMLGGSASYGEYSMGGSAAGFEGMKPAEAKPRPSH
jgi:Amt family ammonium transporter